MHALPDTVPIAMAAAALALLMLHAAWAKLADRATFAGHLAAYGVPGTAIGALAVALPALEATAGLLLATPWRAAGAALAALLLVTYAAAMAWQLARGRRPDCGCGGAPLQVSWALVGRNLVLAMVAAPAATPAVLSSLTLAEGALVAAATVLASLLYAAFNQLLRHHVPMARSLPENPR